MSVNNQIYDKCVYKQQLKQSMSPYDYMFYSGKYENQTQSRPLFGLIGGNNVSQYNGNLVDLESDLFNITRPLSDCCADKYKPGQSNYVLRKIPESQYSYHPKFDIPQGFNQYSCNFFNLN